MENFHCTCGEMVGHRNRMRIKHSNKGVILWSEIDSKGDMINETTHTMTVAIKCLSCTKTTLHEVDIY